MAMRNVVQRPKADRTRRRSISWKPVLFYSGSLLAAFTVGVNAGYDNTVPKSLSTLGNLPTLTLHWFKRSTQTQPCSPDDTTCGERVILPIRHPRTLVEVSTQRGDNLRTGINSRETILDTETVSQRTFGKLYEYQVDGDIYAQPLVISNLLIQGRSRNVVYVATSHNTIYAFDADNPNDSRPLWRVSLGDPIPREVIPIPDSWRIDERKMDRSAASLAVRQRVESDQYHRNPHAISDHPSHSIVQDGIPIYPDFQKEIGVTGTPVIDRETETLYAVSKNWNAKTKMASFYLHALDLRTGSYKYGPPVPLKARVQGKGQGSQNGSLPFTPLTQNQRPALLLSDGVVYIGFSSHADAEPYHGWILGYDKTTLKQTAAYCTTPDGEGGGIWQGGAGLAADHGGNIFVATGDGTYTAHKSGGRDFGDSFLKLTPTAETSEGLKVTDYFTPYNQGDLNARDCDLGSNVPLLAPGTNYLFAGSKDGVLYQMNADNMGKYQPTKHDEQIVARFPIDPTDKKYIYGTPIYAHVPGGNATLFVWAAKDNVKAYQMGKTGHLLSQTVQQGNSFAPKFGKPGGFLSYSCDGDRENSAILWASVPQEGDANRETVSGILHAYDAKDLTHELWSSEMLPERDRLGKFAKFCIPTITGGKVYMGTFNNRLVVYGMQNPAYYRKQITVGSL